MLSREKIRNLAYEKYKLDWMIQHNCTLEDYAEQILELAKAGEETSTCSDSKEVVCAFEEVGFNGTIWASYEEFLSNEYSDKDIMSSLLSQEDLADYQLDVETCSIAVDAVVVDRRAYDGLTIKELNELEKQLGCEEFVPFTVRLGIGYFATCLVSKDYAEERQLDFSKLTEGIENHLVTTNSKNRYGVVEIDSLNVLFWR